jgi:hypothetical protein
MNPFSKEDWKKAAWKAANHPEKAGPGWLIGGVILVLAILAAILRGC